MAGQLTLMHSRSHLTSKRKHFLSLDLSFSSHKHTWRFSQTHTVLKSLIWATSSLGFLAACCRSKNLVSLWKWSSEVLLGPCKGRTNANCKEFGVIWDSNPLIHVWMSFWLSLYNFLGRKKKHNYIFEVWPANFAQFTLICVPCFFSFLFFVFFACGITLVIY